LSTSWKDDTNLDLNNPSNISKQEVYYVKIKFRSHTLIKTMATSKEDDLTGTICGDYIIHKIIGKGTFGKVYVATSQSAKQRGGDSFTVSVNS